jgi:lysozyme
VSTVPGLDVSYWQAEIDWKRVRTTGVRFAFIKATEGVAYTDSTFVHNWEGAGAHGILRGAYCFYHPNQDARQQAERFVHTVRERNGQPELPCSLDLEVTDGVPAKKIQSGVKIWLEEVTQRLGRKPMIYGGVSFLETHFSEAGHPPEWSREYALWLGWFPSRYVPAMSPLMPRGWTRWTFWQYSGDGRVSGIDAPVDLDLFNGNADEFAAFAAADSPATVAKSHIVSAGETADTIANKYSISVGQLMEANPQLIRPGERLVIPDQIAVPPTVVRTYTVIPGDTLDAIARKHGTTIAKLAARNNIQNPNLIHVGQVLVIA